MIVLLALLFISCGYLEAEEVCYEPCGCFSDDPPFDHLPLPEEPADVGIENRLYTRNNTDDHVVISIGNVPDLFIPSKRSMYLIHGYVDDGDFWTETKDTILQSFDFNVIVVHWKEGANNINYYQSASNTRLVGGCTAALIDYLVRVKNAPMSNQYCVGLSLGGEACSFTGKSLNGTLQRITALDPAGIGFEKNDTRTRLHRDDAILVDTIHTDADSGDGFAMGLPNAVSDIDFYPNNGTKPQPGCLWSPCSHVISHDYFIASMDTSSRCHFTAYPCESQNEAGVGNCNTCVPGVNCQRMGYYADTEPGRGIYYLTTHADYPFCETTAPPPRA